MKDLDFDEIDRAVNSLNSDKPTDGINNVNTSVQSDDEQPMISDESSQTLARRRSSGQFMDVVHPSSDMRRPPLVSRDDSLASRIKPIDNMEKTFENDTPIEPTEDIISSDNTSSMPAPNDDGWPDPIDFHESRNTESDYDEKPGSDQIEVESETNTESESEDTKTETKIYEQDEAKAQNQDNANDEYEDADIDKISDDITNEMNQSHDRLPDSPFISGTKVEKRPLGAFSSETTVPPADQVKAVETTDKDEKNGNPEAVVVNDTTLPAELQDDLLLIESGDSSTNPNKSTEINTLVTAETVPMAKIESPEPVSAPVAHSDKPTSITQQYKEHPSTGDQTSGAIYNTDAYHKPLARPAKKKSGWIWVLYIVSMIIVGIGVGVGVSYVLSLLS